MDQWIVTLHPVILYGLRGATLCPNHTKTISHHLMPLSANNFSAQTSSARPYSLKLQARQAIYIFITIF